MSLTNLKRKLAWSLRTAPNEQPTAPDELGSWPFEREEERPFETEDDFEGEGWSFWGV